MLLLRSSRFGELYIRKPLWGVVANIIFAIPSILGWIWQLNTFVNIIIFILFEIIGLLTASREYEKISKSGNTNIIKRLSYVVPIYFSIFIFITTGISLVLSNQSLALSNKIQNLSNYITISSYKIQTLQGYRATIIQITMHS